MNGIPTPFDPKIDRLKQRLQKHPGREGLQTKLRNQKARAYLYNQDRPAPIPYSGQYDSTVAGVNQNLTNTKLDLTGQKLAVEQAYGFGSDTSNPFSQARQLERNYQQRVAGTGNSYAASGQLYAGSLSNARAEDRFQHEQSTDAAIREYQSRLADLARQERDAEAQASQTKLDAEAQRLEDALNQPPDPQEAAGDPRYVRQFLKDQRKGNQGGGGGGGNQGGGNGGQRLDELQEQLKKAKHQDRDNRADKLKDRIKKLRK